MSPLPAASPSPKKVRVAIAIIVGADDRLLICRRKTDTVLAGLWEFPGGKIEPNESAEAAAVREAREELAVEVAPTRTLSSVTHAYPHATVTLTPVLCRHLTGEPRAIGCAEWRWVAQDELASYAFPEANGPLLGQLIDQLQRP